MHDAEKWFNEHQTVTSRCSVPMVSQSLIFTMEYIFNNVNTTLLFSSSFGYPQCNRLDGNGPPLGNTDHVSTANGDPAALIGHLRMTPPPYLRLGFDFSIRLLTGTAHRTTLLYHSPRLRVLQESADSLIRFHRLTGPHTRHSKSWTISSLPLLISVIILVRRGK
jgi:hypothetical protein